MQVANCLNSQVAVKVCIDNSCTKTNPFICMGCHNFECHELHKNCIKTDWNDFRNKLESTKKQNDPKFLNLSAKVEETLRKAMKFLEKEMQTFTLWKERFGMPLNVIGLFDDISERKEDKWTGQQLDKLITQALKGLDLYTLDDKQQNSDIQDIYAKAQELQLMIRKLYSLVERGSMVYNITRMQKNKGLSKQRQLKKLNQRLENLRDYPLNLEIKFSIFRYQKQKLIFKSNRVFTYRLRRTTTRTQSISFVITRCYFELSQNVYNDNNQSIFEDIQLYLKIINLVQWCSDQDSNFDPNLTQCLRNLVLKLYSLTKIVGKALRNEKLKQLKSLTLYVPMVLSDTQNFKIIHEAIASLTRLQSFVLVVHHQQQSNVFKGLGGKFKCIVEAFWWDRENWM